MHDFAVRRADRLRDSADAHAGVHYGIGIRGAIVRDQCDEPSIVAVEIPPRQLTVVTLLYDCATDDPFDLDEVVRVAARDEI